MSSLRNDIISKHERTDAIPSENQMAECLGRMYSLLNLHVLM